MHELCTDGYDKLYHLTQYDTDESKLADDNTCFLMKRHVKSAMKWTLIILCGHSSMDSRVKMYSTLGRVQKKENSHKYWVGMEL